MTRETLEQIIADNHEKAKFGDLFAIDCILGAQAELKKIDKLEKNIAFAQIISGEINWEENLESA